MDNLKTANNAKYIETPASVEILLEWLSGAPSLEQGYLDDLNLSKTRGWYLLRGQGCLLHTGHIGFEHARVRRDKLHWYRSTRHILVGFPRITHTSFGVSLKSEVNF